MALSVGVHNHLLRSALNPKRTPEHERAVVSEYHEAPISADLAADIAAMELAHPRASRDAVRKATGTIIPPGSNNILSLSILSHTYSHLLSHTHPPTHTILSVDKNFAVPAYVQNKYARSMIMDISTTNEMLQREKEEQINEEVEKNRRSPAPVLTASGKFVPAVQIDKTNILLLGPTGSGTTNTPFQHPLTLSTTLSPSQHHHILTSSHPLNALSLSQHPHILSTPFHPLNTLSLFHPLNTLTSSHPHTLSILFLPLNTLTPSQHPLNTLSPSQHPLILISSQHPLITLTHPNTRFLTRILSSQSHTFSHILVTHPLTHIS